MSDDHVNLELQTVHGECLTVPYADDLAEFFFRTNLSYRYDEWAAKGESPNRITSDDISAVNETMAARTPHKHWEQFTTARADLSPLVQLGREWDLFAMSEEAWKTNNMEARIAKVFEAVMGPYRGAAVVTKVLHIKRPALIPVCDSLVAGVMGTTLDNSKDPWAVRRLVVHLRRQGRANLAGLRTIQDQLREAGFDRTLVRILDSILWTSGLKDGPYAVFREWLDKVYAKEAADGIPTR